MKYRDQLPQLNGTQCLTDGGFETFMIFERGIELPDFASFVLLDRPDHQELFSDYYRSYIDVAQRHGCGLLLDTPTWRASSDWVTGLGYDQKDVGEINRRAVAEMERVRAECDPGGIPMPIAACIGPRGDGYVAGQQMSASEAEKYHEL